MSSSGTNTEFNQYQESRQQRVLSNIQELLDTESAGQPTLKTKLWNLVKRIGIPENLEEKFLECVNTLDVWNLLISQKQKQFLEKTIDTGASFDVMKALFNDYCLYSELGRDPHGRFQSVHPRRSPNNSRPRLVRQEGQFLGRDHVVYDDFMGADDMAGDDTVQSFPPPFPSLDTPSSPQTGPHGGPPSWARIVASTRRASVSQIRAPPQSGLPATTFPAGSGQQPSNNPWYGHNMTVWPPTMPASGMQTFSWLLCPIIFWSLTYPDEDEHVFPELLAAAEHPDTGARLPDDHEDSELRGEDLLSVLPSVKAVLADMDPPINTLQDLQPYIDGPNHLTAGFQEHVMNALATSPTLPNALTHLRIIHAFALMYSPEAYNQYVGRITGSQPQAGGGAYIQYGGAHNVYKVSGSVFDGVNGLYRRSAQLYNSKPKYRKEGSLYIIVFKPTTQDSYTPPSWALCGVLAGTEYAADPHLNIYYEVERATVGDYPTQDVVWTIGRDIGQLGPSSPGYRAPIQVTNFNKPALIEVIPYIPDGSTEQQANYYSGTWKFHGIYRYDRDDLNGKAVYKNVIVPTIELLCDVDLQAWSIVDTIIMNEDEPDDPLMYLFTNDDLDISNLETIGITDVLDNRNIIYQGILKWDSIHYPQQFQGPDTLLNRTLLSELDNPADFPYGKISFVQVNEVIEGPAPVSALVQDRGSDTNIATNIESDVELEPIPAPDSENDETGLFLELQRTTIRGDSQRREVKIVREPADADSPEADYFIWKQYLERLFNVTNYKEIPSLVDDDIKIINKFSKIPIGRVEFVGESGLDYGGLRPNFFKLINENISKCFLQTLDRLDYQRQTEQYVEMEMVAPPFQCMGLNNKLTIQSYNNNPFKASEFGSELSYKLAGATLAKMLSCDNGVKAAARHIAGIDETRIIFPNLHLTLYLIERLRGNELDNWLDIVTLFSLDKPTVYNSMMGTFEMTDEELEDAMIAPASQVEARLLEPNTSIDIDDIVQTNENKFAHMYIKAIHNYEHNLLEEIYNFVKGFQLVLPIKEGGICYKEKGNPDDEDKCLTTQDLWYIISGGDIKIEDIINLTRWEFYYGMSAGDKENIKNWFWEIVDEWKQEDVELMYKLLDFWIAQRTLPQALPGRELTINVLELRSGEIRLPESHTCFFKLDIYNYPSKEVFQDKLKTAIDNVVGFSEQGMGLKKKKKKKKTIKTKTQMKKKTRTKTKPKTKSKKKTKTKPKTKPKKKTKTKPKPKKETKPKKKQTKKRVKKYIIPNKK